MQSKGAKKTLKVKIPNNVERKKYDKDSPGALDLNFFISVLNKEGKWKKSKIIECRLDRAIFGDRRLEDVREDPDVKLKEDSYEYYIHYDHMNRRLDEWVKRDRIKPSTEFIDEKRIRAENKRLGIVHSSDEEYEGLDKNARRDHEEATKVKTITRIKFGEFTAEAWYYSPYPDGYHNLDCIYYCEYCLSFYRTQDELRNHMEKCTLVHPPGNQIYVDEER
jgi:histone acetyltransferase HTATIP/histone acetyltransferase MYST1